jgi:hypothetical protein
MTCCALRSSAAQFLARLPHAQIRSAIASHAQRRLPLACPLRASRLSAWERCPFCGNQLISCQCVYKKLRIDVSPGAWAYSHGLTDAQQKDWEKLLGDKGRIPFVLYPNLCAKCGALWPEMFLVPDAEWKHYIEPQMQREMLCKACYKQVKAWIDGEGLGLRRKQTKRDREQRAAYESAMAAKRAGKC